MVSTFLDRLADPLDAARRGLLLAVVRVPWLGRAVARRDMRLLLQSCAGVSVALLLTLLAPGIPYVLGPALFGVAHVVAEVRFLLLRRRVPPRWATVVGLGCAALVMLRLVDLCAHGVLRVGPIEVLVGWGLGIAGAAAGASTSRRPTRGLAIGLPILAVALAAAARPALARLAFAHAHNVVTILVWLWLFRRRPLFAVPALVLIVMAVAWLGSGAALLHVRLDGPFAERFIDESLFALPGGLLSQRAALALGLSFVFLQAIHYAVWLSWVPQEDLPCEGTMSFRSSLRSLGRDLGTAGVMVTLLLALAVIGGSAFAVHRARGIYLSLATFHGYFEVSMLAYFVARGSRVG